MSGVGRAKREPPAAGGGWSVWGGVRRRGAVGAGGGWGFGVTGEMWRRVWESVENLCWNTACFTFPLWLHRVVLSGPLHSSAPKEYKRHEKRETKDERRETWTWTSRSVPAAGDGVSSRCGARDGVSSSSVSPETVQGHRIAGDADGAVQGPVPGGSLGLACRSVRVAFLAKAPETRVPEARLSECRDSACRGRGPG